MARRFRNFSESKILLCLLLVCTLAAPADGISISCSSTAAGETATSRESFTLDDSTSLHEVQAFNSGRISINRQAEGKGNNSIQHTIYGKEYAMQNSIESQGEFAATSSTSASAQSATMNQNMGGSGSLSLELMGREGARDALQEARVNGGSLVSSQSLTAGHGISARQSTEIRGQEGSVLAGALGSDNVVVARGSFEGLGSMKADLGATTQDQASIMGTASIDGVPLLSDHTFRAISGNDEGLGMGMSGLRMIDGGLGNFDMSVISSDLNDARSRSYTSKEKSDKASGGSSSSYALTGFRWNEKNPNIQLYLNPSNIPPGIKAESARDAISAAASTWDEVVDKNLFKDESTVIIDYNKEVPNPFSGEYRADGINMNGFRNFGNNYLAVSTYWTDLTREDGYYSLIESDLLYNLDFEWTDDLKQAENTGKLDLQSVAVHELGHTIGLEDLYILDSSDSRKYDFEQVMNLYDGPQRTLGNGDRAGAQELYGVPDLESLLRSKIGVLRDGAWYLDYNGNGNWDQGEGDVLNFFGTDGDLPAIGDWNGDGRNKIGVLRNGAWYLDYNGNGIWDQSDGDVLNFFGTSGDLPITGDWNADGKDDMSVLRNGEWYQDYNGNGIWDSEDIISFSFALPGDLPVIGDWSGDGKDKIGVLRNGEWYLDYNGNSIWDAEDIFSNSFGINGDLPVAGDWNGDGKDKIGVLRNGVWYFDYNGNGIWDSGDIVSFFGTEGDRPVTKYWI